MASSHALAIRASGGSDAASIVLNGRFEIAYEALSEKLGAPGSIAYGVDDRLNAEHASFVLVCDPELPPRVDALERLKDYPSRALMRLLDWGVVPWPETGDHRFVLAYEWPEGVKLVPSLDVEFEPMAEGEIINRVLGPVTGLLDELSAVGLTHGGINPTNMFITGDKKSQVVMGENASSPAWYHQPSAFLPITLAQATPAGRGAGTIADDIYALGASILMLILGKDPAAGRTDAALLRKKIERGSFLTLSGQARIPPVLREPLRGMLEDQANLRWQISDLQSWLSERRLKNFHHVHMERAQRGFAFHGKLFHYSRTLAQELAGSWDAVQLAENGHEILAWARRGLGDDTIGDAVLNAMERSDRGSTGSKDNANPAFVARLAIALDNKAPVRFRHIAAHPDALGTLLAAGFTEPETVSDITEAFLEDLPGFCLRARSKDGKASSFLIREFAARARSLKNPKIGFGVERCLYEMNPYQYCRSPLVVKQKVMQIGDLLPALEKVSGSRHDGPPFDRHIAAFIATHLGVELSSMLDMASNANNQERATLGMLGVLATLQAQVGKHAYPGVANWIGQHLGPTVESFHHRMWREKVESELPVLINRGDITALYVYLANGEARQRDRDGHAKAAAEYNKLTAEISFLKSYGLNDPARVQEHGHKIAAGLSMLISFIAVVFSLVLMF